MWNAQRLNCDAQVQNVKGDCQVQHAKCAKAKMQCSSLKCKVHKNQNVILELNMQSQSKHDWGIPIGTQKGVLKLLKFIFPFTKLDT